MARHVLARCGADHGAHVEFDGRRRHDNGSAQAEGRLQARLELGAGADRIVDGDLHEAARARVVEDADDPFARQAEPLGDRLLGLAFLEIRPADARHDGAVLALALGLALRLHLFPRTSHGRHDAVINAQWHICTVKSTNVPEEGIMRLIVGLAIALAGLVGTAVAQSTDKFVIGVMGDQSGVVSDVGGKGSVLAARMAVADFGGQVLGKRIEILVADHQNKPDVASPIARRWFDTEGVDDIFDLPHTGVVLGLQNIAREKQKSLLVSGAASVEITGKSCSPYTTHWTDDTYALANATAKAVTKGEGETWYFLTADYSFGHDLERDASNTIRALGGKVLGSSRHPLSTQDFSAYLLQAQSTKARVIGLASAGADTVNAIKQAKEYKIDANGVALPALPAFITDVTSLGLATAQGLIITSGFYWDATDGTRAWARRFMAEHGRMPTREQAGGSGSGRRWE